MGRNGNPYFHFQQFSIWQDQCAMKVGVDGILLGAWASVEQADRILDIGTGTGLIALMLAQRVPTAQITGIEVDANAYHQAQENIARSPWPARIEIEQVSFQHYLKQQVFDLVVSNPPFFKPSGGVEARAIARQQHTLSPEMIIQKIHPHLRATGRLAMILPFTRVPDLLDCAIAHQLYLIRRTDIRPTPLSPFRRSLVEFSPRLSPLTHDEITIELARHDYSPEYNQLIAPFFLKFKS